MRSNKIISRFLFVLAMFIAAKTVAAERVLGIQSDGPLNDAEISQSDSVQRQFVSEEDYVPAVMRGDVVKLVIPVSARNLADSVKAVSVACDLTLPGAGLGFGPGPTTYEAPVDNRIFNAIEKRVATTENSDGSREFVGSIELTFPEVTGTYSADIFGLPEYRCKLYLCESEQVGDIPEVEFDQPETFEDQIYGDYGGQDAYGVGIPQFCEAPGIGSSLRMLRADQDAELNIQEQGSVFRMVNPYETVSE